jgi:lysozyme
VDTIGTGHPVTYCYGQTNENGAVKVGQKFTAKQCSDLLAKSLPKYWDEISPCIHVALPDKVKASLMSGAYNAGSSAMCHSPMVAKMNSGSLVDGCNAFKGWYIRASGRVVKGLINRRNGEAKLCLEGASEPINLPTVQKPSLWRKIIDFIISLFKRS